MATEYHRVPEKQLDYLVDHIRSHYRDRSVAVIAAAALVPETGGFVQLKNREDAEALFLSDVVILVSSTTAPDYESLLNGELDQACFVTAESQTADIEKKLISGVHGPEVCVLVEVQ